MEYYSVVISLLVVAIGLSSLADKIKIPYPILLLGAGIIVGFIPDFKIVPIEPEVIYLIFLPPLLYDAAFNMPFKEFKKNIGTISMMAISLVFITMISIGVVAYFIIPGMTWTSALVIGAILSPPDAAAASGITKSLHLSHRTNIILEGESLLNDASALTAYRIAVAVAIGGIFSSLDATYIFFISIIGGCAIGFVLAHLYRYILKRIVLGNIPRLSLNLLSPFVAYLLAEEFNVSGVLAVVVLGLVNASFMNKENVITEEQHIQFKSVWDTITYILSGLIFILIGLEFPKVIHEVSSRSLIPLFIAGIAIFLIAMITRILVIYAHKLKLDKKILYIEKRSKHSSLFKWGMKNKLKRYSELKPLSWQDATIIGWSGMRGIVSLATAIALPLTMDDGSAYTFRETIIFLTVFVVILMLVIQGLGLPFLIKGLNSKTKQPFSEE